MRDAAALSVADSSQVGEARRLAQSFSAELGFTAEEQGRVALIVTEAATNLIKHGSGGDLLLRKLRSGPRAGIEVMALDRGSGISNLAQSMEDGHSTAGTPGTGLGAINRMASAFQVHSLPGVGTALLAEVWGGGRTLAPGPVDYGVVCLPKSGEEACGDSWAVAPRPSGLIVLVADGLGHGLHAAEASQEAVRCFRAHETRGPAEILNKVHGALRPTRGAAVAVAELDATAREIRFAGIGNIAGTVVRSSGETTHMVSMNGTAGHAVRKVQEFTYPWPAGSLAVLHSDGLTSQWRLGPGLFPRSPSLIAGVLYRDFQRGRDDLTVWAGRAAEPGS